MNDLDQNVAAKLAAIRDKNESKLQAEAPVATEEVKKPEEAVPTEKTEPVVETPAATTDKQEPTPEPAPEKVEEVEFKWDADIVEETPKTAAVDIKKIGSAFELNVTNEEELIKEVGGKLAKLKELEAETAKAFEGVPASLKEAIDIAKKGGDWYSFVENSLLDVTKLDPIDLFEQEYERQEAAKYRNPDGTIDYEKLDEAMDSIPDAIKSMQGNQIKNSLYMQQQQKKQQLVQQAQQSQEVFNMQLTEAVKELPSYFPQDTFGIAVESKHVSSLYDGIASNKLIQKHLGNIDPSVLSKLDAKKLIKTLAMAEWGAGISKAQYNRGLVSGKKELLEKAQNPQINAPSRSAEPEVTNGQKTPAEKLRQLMTGSSPLNSL